jgi:catechol 2,3-dioxygenase-like lactoylglutathione lyase family enzyme
VSEPLQLLRSAPYFPVGNVEQSAAHYERVLGFDREYMGGAPPEFAIMSRDGLAIMLRLVPAAERISPNEKQGGSWDAFFWVRDVRALHAELRTKGANIAYGPVIQEAYQMLEFAVRDNDGHVLGSGNRFSGSPSSLTKLQGVDRLTGCRRTPVL